MNVEFPTTNVVCVQFHLNVARLSVPAVSYRTRAIVTLKCHFYYYIRVRSNGVPHETPDMAGCSSSRLRDVRGRRTLNHEDPCRNEGIL